MKARPQHIKAINAVTPIVVTSSTDATPVVVTATGHGLATGDTVAIQGHTTNLAANGIFKVTKVNANSFSLQNWYTGANIAGTGAGAGASGVLYANPKVIYTGDHDSYAVTFGTSGTATLGLKIAGTESNMFEGEANLGGTKAIGNQWEFLDYVFVNGGGAIVDGDTEVAWSGADSVQSIEVNADASRFIAILVTSFTQGALTANVSLYDQS